MLSLGVDFGSTGLRAARLGAGGRVEPLAAGTGNGVGLLCEARPDGALGVSFPSLKSRLGRQAAVTWEGRRRQPAEVVGAAFRHLAESVTEALGERPQEVVVTVPALYSASQRAALRQAVLDAGFTEVHLLTDSVAAVLARGGGEEAATVLVYGMGYGGFEVGLIRAGRGRYRALGYEGGAAPAGQALDGWLLQGCLAALRGRHLCTDAESWDAARWLAARAAVEQAREALSDRRRVDLDLAPAAAAAAAARVAIDRAGLERAIAPALRATLEHADSLLAQAGLTPDDLDHVLLAGGTARTPVLQRVIGEWLGREPQLLGRDELARGAAVYAARLDGQPPPAAPEHEQVSEAPPAAGTLAAADALAGAITVLAPPPPAATAPPPPPAPDELLARAARLLEEGRNDEAAALLEGLIGQAQALLERARESPAPPRESPARVLARRALVRARQCLERESYEEAVRESHRAWQQDPDDPETFEEMIDVHCRAAELSASYEDAQRWLGCAHTHDQGNARVRQLLAERHFLHARRQSGEGRHRQALEALEHCFAWDPEHPGARELHGLLLRQ